MKRILRAALLVFSSGQLACISFSTIQIDSKTTLEQQAAGSYPQLSGELGETAIQPGPVPLTREQLAATANAEPAATEQGEPTDAARIDALLTRRCIGEGLEGKLLITKATCAGDPDEQEVAALTERANKKRQQIWTYLGSLHPSAKPQEVRAAWRVTRMRAVICGGQVQTSDGSWEKKKC